VAGVMTRVQAAWQQGQPPLHSQKTVHSNRDGAVAVWLAACLSGTCPCLLALHI
jgi:hypothetical protein